ncbi:MAG: hypothetical protein H6741_00290 [Alphaproteobacteria bacterium]|nr:hypothetical protein [Alphaproteobacteria bacterium]
MPFLDVLHAYFDAEQRFGLLFIAPAGLAFIGVAAYTWLAEQGGFRWGLALPLGLFGLAILAVGVGLALRTPGQVEALVSAYQASPAAFLADELPRMDRVNANWTPLLATWTVLTLAGLGLRFGLHRDWAEGLGAALVLIGGLGIVVDSLSERRARPYTEALAAQAQEHAPPSSL